MVHDADAVVLAYGTLYDKRGGAVETEIKESKQGIGITKRSKKRFEHNKWLCCWEAWHITLLSVRSQKGDYSFRRLWTLAAGCTRVRNLINDFRQKQRSRIELSTAY